MSTFIVKLNVRERAPGYLSAICPDVPGLHLAGETLEQLRSSALLAIPRLLKVNRNMNVVVSSTDDLTEFRVREL